MRETPCPDPTPMKNPRTHWGNGPGVGKTYPFGGTRRDSPPNYINTIAHERVLPAEPDKVVPGGVVDDPLVEGPTPAEVVASLGHHVIHQALPHPQPAVQYGDPASHLGRT